MDTKIVGYMTSIHEHTISWILVMYPTKPEPGGPAMRKAHSTVLCIIQAVFRPFNGSNLISIMNSSRSFIAEKRSGPLDGRTDGLDYAQHYAVHHQHLGEVASGLKCSSGSFD